MQHPPISTNIDGAGADLAPTSTQVEANNNMRQRLMQAQQAINAFLGQAGENPTPVMSRTRR